MPAIAVYMRRLEQTLRVGHERHPMSYKPAIGKSAFPSALTPAQWQRRSLRGLKFVRRRIGGFLHTHVRDRTSARTRVSNAKRVRQRFKTVNTCLSSCVPERKGWRANKRPRYTPRACMHERPLARACEYCARARATTRTRTLTNTHSRTHALTTQHALTHSRTHGHMVT